MSAAFDGLDALSVTSLLTEEALHVQRLARRVADEALAPRVVQDFRSEGFDRAVVRALGEAGLLGVTLPAPFGRGASYLTYGVVAREIEAVDSGYRSVLSVQSSLVMDPIWRFGSARQHDEWLPRLATGEAIGAFALTEPDHGSDPGAMTTSARRVAGGWTLTGTKAWITNATLADVIVVWAKDTDGHLRGFLVRRGARGLTTPLHEGRWSLRASLTGRVVMDEVFVPDDDVLEGARGFAAPFACLHRARFGIAWGVTGAARSCLEVARAYVASRTAFGRPLAATQLVQTKLVDMATDLALATLAAWRLAALFDAGQDVAEAVSLLKRNNVGRALETARTARDMLGANGISDAYPVMRHLMNLETVNTYEGTYDIHGLIVGRALTGIAAFGA
jgi:glutaryl-CoA dehydrogenase